MNDSIHTIKLPYPRGTVEEVLENHRQNDAHHGNDLDLLTQSMMLIQAGHYREAAHFAMRVQTPSSVEEELPAEVNKLAAQTAFLAAAERSRPLHEQAALEIEGNVEGSQTMLAYEKMMAMLRNDPNW